MGEGRARPNAGKAPLSLRELRKTLKEKDANRKRKGSGWEGRDGGSGTDADDAGVGRAREEELAVAPSEKKLKARPSSEDPETYRVSEGSGSGGGGMGDAGDGLDDRALEEAPEVEHTAKSKRKSPPPPRERAGAKEAKRVRKDSGRKGTGGSSSGCGGRNGEPDEGEEDLQESHHAGHVSEGTGGAKEAKRRGSKGRDPGGGGQNGESDDGGKDLRETTVVVAHTPNLPQRYALLLRNISFLLPYKNQGQAYECPLNRISALLKWSQCSFCLFFEWVEKGQRMLCRMFDTLSGICVAFLVNPAFASEMFEVKVKSATFAFSSSFCCDEKWAGVKDILMGMFRPQREEVPETPDYLYVFTRIDDYVYIRNLKIDSIPALNSEGKFILTEVGPSFCLRLLNIQDINGKYFVSDRVSDVSQSQMKPNLILSPTLYYSMSADELGSCTVHTLSLSGEDYMILLEDGMKSCDFEGFSVSLGEYLSKESFLKIKHIIGSETDEECTFVRNIGKSIIRSILVQIIKLFASGKCIKTETKVLDHSNILLKGSSAKFYGVKIVRYEEDQAKDKVVQIVELIRQCFLVDLIPSDLVELLDFLLKDPLRNLEAAKESCALLSAKERKELLVYLHTEYMTNVRPNLSDRNLFFSQCPYLDSWMDTVKSNRYLKKSANLESKRVSLIVKEAEEGKKGCTENNRTGVKGELQFSFMRNSHVHIPEEALKDGVKSFRPTWSDYILSAYFRKYLPYIQKLMAPYLKSRGGGSRQS